MAFINQATLDGFSTLADVVAWANVTGTPGDRSTLLGAFLLAAGASMDTPPRTLGVVSESDFNQVANAVVLVSGGPDAPVSTPPNLVQKGAITSVGYACRLKTGLLASLPAVAPPPNNAVSAAFNGGGGCSAVQGQA